MAAALNKYNLAEENSAILMQIIKRIQCSFKKVLEMEKWQLCFYGFRLHMSSLGFSSIWHESGIFAFMWHDTIDTIPKYNFTLK